MKARIEFVNKDALDIYDEEATDLRKLIDGDINRFESELVQMQNDYIYFNKDGKSVCIVNMQNVTMIQFRDEENDNGKTDISSEV